MHAHQVLITDAGRSAVVFRSELMTVEEIAEAYKCSLTLVKSMVRDGALPTVRIGRTRVVRRRELDRLLRQVDRLRMNGTVLPIARRTRTRRRTPA